MSGQEEEQDRGKRRETINPYEERPTAPCARKENRKPCKLSRSTNGKINKRRKDNNDNNKSLIIIMLSVMSRTCSRAKRGKQNMIKVEDSGS